MFTLKKYLGAADGALAASWANEDFSNVSKILTQEL